MIDATNKEILLSEYNSLPKGTIIRRTIRGTERFYHQWREDGKTKSRYIPIDELNACQEKMNRKNELKIILFGKKSIRKNISGNYNTNIIFPGTKLDMLLASAMRLTLRSEIKVALELLRSPSYKPILITGKTQTGKTVALRQLLNNLILEEKSHCALITLTNNDTLKSLCEDIEILKEKNINLIFIDNLSLIKECDDFLTLVCDVYSKLGLKFIIAHKKQNSLAVNEIYLTHLPTSSILQDATSSINSLQNFLNLSFGEDAFSRFLLQTRNFLFDEENIVNIDDFVEDKMLCACKSETVSKIKKQETIFLCAHYKMRFLVGEYLIDILLSGEEFLNHGALERKQAREALLHTLRERVLEENILLSTLLKKSNSTTHVFALRFNNAGRGFAITHDDDLTCELYTVRDASVREEIMLIDLANPGKLDIIEHRHGLITAREVLYFGRTAHHSTGILFRTIKDEFKLN